VAQLTKDRELWSEQLSSEVSRALRVCQELCTLVVSTRRSECAMEKSLQVFLAWINS
jgi:hypothetical protein